ncbi:MAG: right-handed parallel beta-helix repeat-containing protein, partial [Spirochaetota bacterium]|nr:right-handed parallel beta-helix repeat-containing protein [Spirochaetota bacterium]
TLKNDEPPINEDITGYGEDPSSGYTESQVHVYYLDANNGNDTTGDGTSGNPWQSILKVQDVMEAGDTIILQDGNYGYFSETSSVSRTDWITIKADIGAVPVLTGINVNYASITDSYLRFDGIDLQVDDSLTDNGISLSDLRYFELRNCTVHHQLDNKYLIGTGLTIRNSDYVLIYHNHIHSVARGFSILNAQNVTIYLNHVHRLGGGTGIQYAGNCSNFIIEKNNIYDSNHDPLDPDAPDDPHGSAISIRSGDVWIKDNIFHDIGSSSGIMFYTPDAAGGEEAYMNIIIENNLLYDIHNTSILRMYNLGTNVIVRNNTIIGKVRTDTSMGCYKLNSVLSVHTIADGYDGSGLEVCNNILAGTADIPSNAMISNNIFWSFYYDEDPHNFLDTLADNIIITSGNDYPIDYFTDSFFIGIDEESDFEDGHGMILDFNLHSSSEAINFGDPDNQTSKGLASIGPDGFIQFDGIPRDANHHSAGCYEY